MRNVEGAVVSYLKTVPGVGTGVGTRLPNPRPARFVRVQRVGGAQINMIEERPTILVESWGATDTEAWLQCVAAHEALQGREPLEQNGIEFGDRDCASPVNYPDPSTASPRYQFTFQANVAL